MDYISTDQVVITHYTFEKDFFLTPLYPIRVQKQITEILRSTRCRGLGTKINDTGIQKCSRISGIQECYFFFGANHKSY